MADAYFQQVTLRYSAQQISDAIDRLADEITTDLAGLEPVIVVLLKGSFMFAADLVRRLEFPLQLEFLAQKSYFGRQSTGRLEQTLNLTGPITGRHVLVIDDIRDTAFTIDQTVAHLSTLDPESLRVCCLIERIGQDAKTRPIDYAGFNSGPGYLVGYGLDLDQRWRNLPFIGTLDPPEHA